MLLRITVRHLFITFCCTVLGILATVRVFEWREHLWLRGIDSQKAFEQGALTDFQFSKNEISSRQVDIDNLERGINRFSPARAYTKLASLYREQAYSDSNSNQAEDYCKALASLGRAIQMEPHNARYLVNWANLRQLLGSYRCNDELPKGRLSETIDAAVKLAPVDPWIGYAAGLIEGWAGNEERASIHLHSVLLHMTDIGAGVQANILAKLKSGEDVERIVPARFPQVVQWAAYCKNTDRYKYKELELAFAKLQLRALESNRVDLAARRISHGLYVKRLISVLPVADVEAVRKFADRELAAAMKIGGEESLARYLQKRASLEKLEIVRAALESDTRPLKTPLSRWGGHDALISFDQFYASLGFYVPVSQTPHFIELTSLPGGATVSPTNIKIYVSEDNQQWQELPEAIAIEGLSLNNQTILTLYVGEGAHTYWKIHFASSLRLKKFSNTLNEILKVYGMGALQN